LEAREEEEAEDPHAVVSGTLPVNHLFTQVLYDACATHCFINPATIKRLACEPDEMDVQLCVATPVGLIYQIEDVVRNCLITIHDKVFPIDLVLLEIQRHDVILGIDKTTIDSKRQLLNLVTPKGEKLEYKGTNHKQATLIILPEHLC